MKGVYVGEMVEDQAIDGVFLVSEKRMAETRSGAPYLRLRLSDRTGEIEGRVWEQAFETAKAFERDDFVRVKGRVSRYQDTLQISIRHIQRLCGTSVDPSDFLPRSNRDIEGMWDELRTVARGVENRDLRELLDAFFGDPEFASSFKRAPAAKKLHHVYIGGLLEHTLNLCRLALAVSEIYEGLNRDVLIAGAILHDIGKVQELTSERSFDYSDRGRLLGHLVIGVEMLDEKIAGLESFSEELALILKHMILSHHGQYAWGSPKRPKTLEAIVLHHLDDMDAKFNGVQEFLEKSSRSNSRWTEHHRVFDQFFYHPDFEESET
ncbi:MAG: HD domain-containing protein [Deltaproteobacteria bacterium]|nr:HD domain-containing protein [Deltaproteobacteria bacterium]